MIVVTALNLIIVRQLLNVMGVIDYGIFNVVGGLVLSLSFVNGSLNSAIQRFFSIALGKNDLPYLKSIYETSKTVFYLISLVSVIILGIIGLWLINNKLTIPVEKIESAWYVLIFSIFAFAFTLLTTTDRSLHIAYENMKTFSFFSIIETVLKLIAAVIIALDIFDNKIVYYSIFLCLVSVIIFLLYKQSTINRYKLSFVSLRIDNTTFKEVLSFSGWSMIGAMSYVFKNQGVNIILNIFFGPIVNASRAIAMQVSSLLNNFIVSISQSVNPAIIKSYSKGNYTEMYKLVIQSSKMIAVVGLSVSIPLIFGIDYLLKLWLNEVPLWASIFCQLTIIDTLVNSFSNSLGTSVNATGKIKLYQIVVGGVMLLNLPVSYLFLLLDFSPEITLKISITTSFIALFFRLILLGKLICFPINLFLKDFIFPYFLIITITVLIILLIQDLLPNNIYGIVLLSLISTVSIITTVIMVGLKLEERNAIVKYIKTKFNDYKQN